LGEEGWDYCSSSYIQTKYHSVMLVEISNNSGRCWDLYQNALEVKKWSTSRNTLGNELSSIILTSVLP